MQYLAAMDSLYGVEHGRSDTVLEVTNELCEAQLRNIKILLLVCKSSLLSSNYAQLIFPETIPNSKNKTRLQNYIQKWEPYALFS